MLLKLYFIAKEEMDRGDELRRRDLLKPPPKASTIFRKDMLNSFPNTRRFLQNLLSNIEIINSKVGESFDYPDRVIENGIYVDYGIFMNYFIRKHLSNQYHTGIEDIANEVVLNKQDVYFNDRDLKRHIFVHYNIFRNPQTMAMDILESIKIVSLAYSATFDEERVRRVEIDSQNEMLLEVIRHFQSLPFEYVSLTPNLNCDYFRALPDFIFDNGQEKVLYNIKTSKYVTLDGNADYLSPENFYILIAYAFAYYKTYGVNPINTFVIYNPLLGYEHKIVMKNIDFEEFERCIATDYENKYGQDWRRNPPERW